jgi:hypothetical protein
MKRLITGVILIFISFSANSLLWAQSYTPPIGPSTYVMHPYYGQNHNIPGFHHVGGYKKEVPSQPHVFAIVFREDSIVQVNTKIDVSYKRHFLIAAGRKGQVAITPLDTKEIYRMLPSGVRMTGVAADSCWLFKVRSGKINSYSFLAEPETKYVIAIQKGQDGPVIPLNSKNLLDMMGENVEADVLELIEKKKLTKAIELFNSKIN